VTGLGIETANVTKWLTAVGSANHEVQNRRRSFTLKRFGDRIRARHSTHQSWTAGGLNGSSAINLNLPICAIRRVLEAAGVEFIDESGGGPACGSESGSTENLGIEIGPGVRLSSGGLTPTTGASPQIVDYH
jgi:hypothetical protein